MAFQLQDNRGGFKSDDEMAKIIHHKLKGDIKLEKIKPQVPSKEFSNSSRTFHDHTELLNSNKGLKKGMVNMGSISGSISKIDSNKLIPIEKRLDNEILSDGNMVSEKKDYDISISDSN